MINEVIKILLFLSTLAAITPLRAQEKSDPSERGAQLKKITIDDHGAIIRGDLSQKQIALVFTGDEFADGAEIIQYVLAKQSVKASFFFSGKFYSNPDFKSAITKLKRDGHYLGAHSDKHLLYADWTKRDSLLVTQNEFKDDLQNNYNRMSAFGIKKHDAKYFIAPYEWYNSKISEWTKALDLQLINFTPGTRSAADYTYPETGARYRSSEEIYKSILTYEAEDQYGLNGFILLLHIGTDPKRTDKFYNLLGHLISELKSKNYTFVRIDQLLE